MTRPLLALLLVLLPGCAIMRTSENVPLDAARLEVLEPGTTTAAQVVEALGAPVDVVQLGRRSAYYYRFTNIKRAGLVLVVVNFLNVDERTDRAWVFFDENQVLTHVGVTLQGAEARYALPWENLYE